MGGNSWWQNLLKGGIAETICATHFRAARWHVAETGIEHIIPSFAQRERNEDKDNELRIQEHVGSLPDLLVHRPASGHYLIEVKFRGKDVTSEVLESLTVELLWHYKHLVFRRHEANVFKSITPAEWHEQVTDTDPGIVDRRKRFNQDLSKNAQWVSPDMIKLPLLFYIVSPSTASSVKVHLICPQLSGRFGYVAYSLHDASRSGENTQDIRDMVAGLRDAWRADIQPSLDCMFPALAAAAPAPPVAPVAAAVPATTPAVAPVAPASPVNKEAFHSALRGCVERVVKNSTGRKGAYFPEIIADADFWTLVNSLGVKTCTTIEEVGALLTDYGVPVTVYKQSKMSKYYVELASLPV